MLRNYLTVALRHLTRQKTYTAINIVGLALGMTSVILLGLFVIHERSYNRHHANAEKLYRIVRQTVMADGAEEGSEKVSGNLGALLKETYPEIEEVVRFYRWNTWIRVGQDVSNRVVCLADEAIFEVFSFPLRSGDGARILSTPATVLVSELTAQQLFGDSDPVGQTLSMEGRFWGDYTVGGVLKDVPNTSSMNFDILVTPAGVQNPGGHWFSWRGTGARFIETYVMIPTREMAARVEARMQSIFAEHMGDDIAERNAYRLQPFLDVHLRSQVDYGIFRNVFSMQGGGYGSATQVQAAALVGLFILLMACVNFVNLSTARASIRAKEVGLRKVVGARRVQIFGQLLGEAVLISVFSLLVAVVVSQLLLPTFADFVGRPLSFSAGGPFFIPVLAVLALFVGAAAGLYPAMFLSAYQPSRVLKLQGEARSGGAVLRKALVVLQFGISIVLIVGALASSAQMRYVRSNLGFATENVLIIPIFYVGNSSGPSVQQRFEGEVSGGKGGLSQTSRRSGRNDLEVLSSGLFDPG